MHQTIEFKIHEADHQYLTGYNQILMHCWGLQFPLSEIVELFERKLANRRKAWITPNHQDGTDIYRLCHPTTGEHKPYLIALLSTY
jgi:hypothetical protein